MAVRPAHGDTGHGLHSDSGHSLVRTSHCGLFRHEFRAHSGLTMQPLRIVVAGAAGRMGRAVIRAISECNDLRLAGALGASGRDYSGKDAGELAACAAVGVAITDDARAVLGDADAIVDFT